MDTRGTRHLTLRLAQLAGLLLSPALCIAQEQSPIVTANETDAADIAGPQNLPGHPKRDAAPEAPKPATPREWFGELNYFQWTRLTGDWGGTRTKLEDAGLTFAASFTLDWSTVTSGGIENRASSRDLFDFNFTLDTDKAFKLPGGTFYVDFMASDGRGAGDSGDYTGISNIATGANTAQLAELWYQQSMFDDKLRAKIGKIEANTDFAYFNCTPDFLNGASAMPATLYPAFPTYPNPATGIDLFYNPCKQFYIGAGVFDGSLITGNQTGRVGPASAFRGDGTLFLGEIGSSWKLSSVTGRASIGTWYDTAEITDFAGNPQKGSGGFYIMGEQQLLTREGDDAEKGLFIFGELGLGDANVNPAAMHTGCGLSCLGTFPGRDSDSAGCMVNWIDMSNAPGSPFVGDETYFELYYKLQVTPAVSLTPNLQWIKNPSGDTAISDTLVVGIRANLSF